MKIAEMMTREVFSAFPDCPLDEAIRIMETHGFRHLPVLDGGRLVGILSDRDIALATGWIPAHSRASRDTNHPRFVREIMTRQLHTLPGGALASDAAALILEHRISAVPILKEGRLAGLITTTDLLRGARKLDLDSDWRLRDGALVRDWMTGEVKTVSPDQQILEALGLCMEAQVRHLPVVADETLVGMISDRDLRFGLGREIASDLVAQGEGRMELAETPLSALMASDVVTIEPSQFMLEAADSMLEHGFSALPVVEDRRLVGILTQTDMLRSCC